MERQHGRSRSRSPLRGPRASYRDGRLPRDSRRQQSPAAKLPLNARRLSKHDFSAFQPLFATYLDVQKGIYIEDLDEREVKGRWKSFVGKWNRAELAEGWYDPVTLRKAQDSTRRATPSPPPARSQQRQPPPRTEDHDHDHNHDKSGADTADDDDDDDEIGPLPLRASSKPTTRISNSTSGAGPSIPSLDDLTHRDELVAASRSDAVTALRHERRLDRAAQRAALDDTLPPRPDPGTHAARVEKRAGARETQAAYLAARHEGGDADVGDAEAMGGDAEADGYRAARQEEERRKSEREVRREELWRARAAEREERLREVRAKEEKTMGFLRALARERFGGGE